jgi:hypothetical protein
MSFAVPDALAYEAAVPCPTAKVLWLRPHGRFITLVVTCQRCQMQKVLSKPQTFGHQGHTEAGTKAVLGTSGNACYPHRVSRILGQKL